MARHDRLPGPFRARVPRHGGERVAPRGGERSPPALLGVGHGRAAGAAGRGGSEAPAAVRPGNRRADGGWRRRSTGPRRVVATAPCSADESPMSGKERRRKKRKQKKAAGRGSG